MSDDEINRVDDPIQSQKEADGLRAGLERRRTIPAADLSPQMEEQLALDEARLAEWDARPENTDA